MIPIDETKIEEREIDGVKYSFRPIIGETELLFHRVLNLSGPKQLKHYIAESKKQIDSENIGKVWAVSEKENAVRERTTRLANEAGEGDSIFDNIEAITALDRLIDSVLVGWVSSTSTVPKFPDHKQPSKCFKIIDKLKLLNIIGEMNSVGETETKN
jgi:hypothetical protein